MDDNQDYKYYLDSGIKATNAGKFEDALELLNKALELNPESSLANFSKGIVFHNLNQLQAAIENYTKAIELDSGMVDAYYNRAQAVLAFECKSDDELRNALADLEKAVELDSKFVDALYYGAVVRKKLQDYKGALEFLDRVLDIEPQAVYSKALKKLILTKYLK